MSIQTNTNLPLFIPFNQDSDVIQKLDVEQHKVLIDFNDRFQGLCELICNRILLDDVLDYGRDENYLKNHITVDRLNEKRITKSHILDVYSLLHKMIAYLFAIYPDSIFSFWDQWRLVNSRLINAEVLNRGLKNIENGTTLKLQVLSRDFFKFQGHSLLIKKIEDNKYIFFDPNYGESRGLSFSDLKDKINDQLMSHDATDIYITRGSDYLYRARLGYANLDCVKAPGSAFESFSV